MQGQEKDDPSVALLHERLEGRIQLIGLTGGIASGKTTVASFFEGAKIPVIDADQISRIVVKPKTTAYREIVASFGEGVIQTGGELDREKIAGIVFADGSKRKLLESITHPAILKQILRTVRGFKKKKVRAVVIDAALLFESGLSRLMHKNILVRVHPEIQMKRLMKRDQLTEAEAWPRVLSQMPTPEKEKLADIVIDNSGTLEETSRQVQETLKQLI